MPQDYREIDLPSSQSFRARHEEEKKVNIYFVPFHNPETGRSIYAYIAASALLHDRLMAAMEEGDIPDFAVVVEKGEGEPSSEVKDKIKRYYGFDHDAVLSAANSNNSASGSGSYAA